MRMLKVIPEDRKKPLSLLNFFRACQMRSTVQCLHACQAYLMITWKSYFSSEISDSDDPRDSRTDTQNSYLWSPPPLWDPPLPPLERDPDGIDGVEWEAGADL